MSQVLEGKAEMTATIFSIFVCLVLALLSAAIGAASGKTKPWNYASVVFLVVAVLFWWAP